jgi:hypothetical protein
MLADADVLVLLPEGYKSRGVKLKLIIRRFLGIRVVTLKRLVKELRSGNF